MILFRQVWSGALPLYRRRLTGRIKASQRWARLTEVANYLELETLDQPLGIELLHDSAFFNDERLWYRTVSIRKLSSCSEEICLPVRASCATLKFLLVGSR